VRDAHPFLCAEKPSCPLPQGERAQEARAAYSGSPCSIMQVRCIASCCAPQVDCDIFPALALQSRSAFSRAALMPDSPRCPAPSLRCAKLGVAKAETASPSASAAATCLFLRPITNLLPTRPSSRDNARGQKSSAAPALHTCKPAGRNRQGTRHKIVMPRDSSLVCPLALAEEHREATDTVASEFVARMSVSEIRGCPACRFAHAGYAVLARE
jgi:hypothetical protein